MKKRTVLIVIMFMLLWFGLNLFDSKSSTFNSVIVAVIDTGLNIDDTIDKNRIIYVDDSIDDIGHGTQIVQLIQNNTNDCVSIMPIKVVDSNGSASIDDVCNGILKAVDSGANIINLSLNTVFYHDSSKLQYLIEDLYLKGIYVIVSAGNEKEDTKYLTPANIDEAIVVGAVAKDGKPYFFSNYGEAVDLSALGLYNGNLGSSFAAAYVTSYCANLMSEGCQDIESELYNNLSFLSKESKLGRGYLEYKGQNIGESDKEESEIYLGKRDKTLNEKSCNILEIDWRSLSTDELDAIIGETDYKYVGLLLSRLSDSELADIKEKSAILNTTVSRLDTKYNSDTLEYEVYNSVEVDYVDYCIREYDKEKESMFLTSEWVCKTSDAIMYISSPDRQKIYKYTLTGLKGHIWVDGSPYYSAFTSNGLSIVSSIYKDEDTSYQFTKPTPIRLSTFVTSVRATRVDSYLANGSFMGTVYSWNYIGEQCDDASLYVGISIKFNNYSNKKTGYHNNESSIVMYNAEQGIGTSLSEAMIYTYNYEGSSYPQRYNLHFNNTELGYVKYWYNGVFKDGYNMHNATTIETSLVSCLYGEKGDIYLSTGQTSINDTNGTFTLNMIPHFGLGTQWYEHTNNVLQCDSDIPEIVFNLAPNTYTVKFNGNGATGGNTADQQMVYDSGYHLNANGFTRTGYTFLGWSADPNGSVQYNNQHYVSNMSATNGGVVTLYAQWTPNAYSLTLNHNGGDYNGATSNSYAPTFGYSYYYDISWGLPTREGYTFNGYWTSPTGGTQIYTPDGKGVNNGICWYDGVWCTAYNATVYAQWTPNSNNMVLDYNGGRLDNTTSATYQVTYGTGNYCNISWGLPTRNGYIFDGFWTEQSGGVQVYGTDGICINDGTYWKNKIWSVNSGAIFYAHWIPKSYTMTLDHNYGSYNGSSSNDYIVTYDTSDYSDISKYLPTRIGYIFDGYWTWDGTDVQVYDSKGICTNEGVYWKDNIWVYDGNDPAFYAQWKPNTYEVYFDANGGDGVMDVITLFYDTEQCLPANEFTKRNEHGPSTFLGWSTDASDTSAIFENGAKVTNLPGSEEGAITLYAIWDDCPWIIAEDLYYSLYEAQNGLITYAELMNKAEAFDKEVGSALLPGIDTEKGTSFTIIDYLPTDFTQFTAGGSVTETYQVIDSAGNKFKKMITVHIVDTTPVEILPDGTTRFISEKYYNETYENGGLEADSAWKTDPEFVAVIQEAFDNQKNDTPIMSFSFTHEEILEMKEFIGINGIGNSKNPDALQQFYDIFMVSNMAN